MKAPAPQERKLQELQMKVNVASLYNSKEEYQVQSDNKKEDFSKSQKYKKLLDVPIVDIEQLKNLSWHGITDGILLTPLEHRTTVWKILLNYQSPNRDAQFAIVERKRAQYDEMCKIYFSDQTQNLYDDREKKIIKLIESDITRNNPQSTFFRNSVVQAMLRRILFIWNIRNPACGYVQGINDIVSVFLAVFLSDYVDIDFAEVKLINEKQMEHLDCRLANLVEADSFWCLSKMLDSVIDNYTQDQPGLIRFYKRVSDILTVLDKELLDHFESIQINLYTAFIFKWANCILLRLFNFQVGVRLFDTLISENQGFNEFSTYIVVTILLKFTKKIKKMKEEDVMFFMEKLPTKQWSDQDLSLCLAEAYSYKQILSSRKS